MKKDGTPTFMGHSIIPEIAQQQPERLIMSVSKKLRAFVNETVFDVSSFSNEHDTLADTLVEAHAQLESNPSSSKGLVGLFSSTKHVFLEMLHARELLEDLYHYAQEELIAKFIELYVISLSLRDPWGSPDIDRPDFVTRMRYLYRRLYYWKICFENLDGTSLKMRIFFPKRI